MSRGCINTIMVNITPNRLIFVAFVNCLLLIYTSSFKSSDENRLKTTSLLEFDSKNRLYPSSVDLINLKNFKYILNSDICGAPSVKIVGIVIIHSHPANVNRRTLMRQEMPSDMLLDAGLKRVFMLANADNASTPQADYKKVDQFRVDKEHEMFHDIVQGNFYEHYHNLTYKHIMGLQWVVDYCSEAIFIIKMDDDIITNLFQFRDFLVNHYAESSMLIAGLLQVEAKPVRNPTSKWYVSPVEFRPNFYEKFVSGWTYAMTVDAAIAILAESKVEPYFWIDDVHITGTLAEKAHVRREAINKFYTVNVDYMRCCVEMPNYRDFYCDFMVGPSEGEDSVMKANLIQDCNCFVRGCKYRPPAMALAKTCINAKAPPLQAPHPGVATIIKLGKR